MTVVFQQPIGSIHLPRPEGNTYNTAQVRPWGRGAGRDFTGSRTCPTL